MLVFGLAFGEYLREFKENCFTVSSEDTVLYGSGTRSRLLEVATYKLYHLSDGRPRMSEAIKVTACNRGSIQQKSIC